MKRAGLHVSSFGAAALFLAALAFPACKREAEPVAASMLSTPAPDPRAIEAEWPLLEPLNDDARLAQRIDQFASGFINPPATNCTPKTPPLVLLPKTDAGNSDVARAVAYLAKGLPRIDPTVPSVLQYLARRFEVDLGALRDVRFAALVSNDPSFAYYAPMFGEPVRVKSAPHASAYWTQSIVCKRFPLPANQLTVLQDFSERGGYFLTHAVLAVEWAAEQGCITKSGAWKALADRQAALLVSLAEAEYAKGTSDLFLEALAMLYYIGRGDAVRPDWITSVKASQRADGGWSRNPGDRESNGHSTVLALWILLEDAQPGKPLKRWTRQG